MTSQDLLCYRGLIVFWENVFKRLYNVTFAAGKFNLK